MHTTTPTVVTCYDLLDGSIAGGVHDFTDGKYNGNPSLPYQEAQDNQANWLLDSIHCQEGSSILDIGCGNGRMLETAERRNAHATGVTISEQQILRNKKKGLDVHLVNYRNIPQDWNGRFDGIIANGSAEHFVQVQDVIEGKHHELYRELFEICHRITRPGARFATTIIHMNQDADPKEIARGSHAHKRGSDYFHLARVLLEDFGCWFPEEGVLEKAAEGYFTLEKHEDGTEDYHWTSEEWLRRLRRQIPTNPKVWCALTGKMMRHPRAMSRLFDTLVFAQSWMWQFREREGRGTPTKLFRDVWKRVY